MKKPLIEFFLLKGQPMSNLDGYGPDVTSLPDVTAGSSISFLYVVWETYQNLKRIGIYKNVERFYMLNIPSLENTSQTEF